MVIDAPPAARGPAPTTSTSTTATRLVAAARAMLDEQGLEGLILRPIARRAGVSQGAPLRHFPTLAVLLSTVAVVQNRRYLS